MLMLFWIPILISELKMIRLLYLEGLIKLLRSSCSSVGIHTRRAHCDAFGSDDGSTESPLTIMRVFTVGKSTLIDW